MKKRHLVIFPLLAFLFCQNLQGQGVRRSVIASFGDSGTLSNGIQMSCTAAQPPNAGTIVNNGTGLRQGFQQPVNDDGSGPNPDCVDAPAAEFITDFTIDACGQYFDFQYAGVPEPGSVFLWDFGAGAMPPTSTQQNPTGVGYASIGPRTITLTIVTGDCEDTATDNVTVVQEAFGAMAESVDLTCATDRNGSIQLTAVNGEAPFDFKWDSGETTDEIKNLAPGIYSYTVTDANGCIFVAEAQVGSPDSILVNFTTGAETCNGTNDGTIEAAASGGLPPYSYLWSNGSAAGSLAGIGGGSYSLTVIDASGCQASFTADVLVSCEDMVFDNVITPNGDGANDAWVIPDITNFPDNELVIFNRWGNKVFSQKGYDNTWQGTNEDGKTIPIGAYFFVLELNDEAGTVYSGSISILR